MVRVLLFVVVLVFASGLKVQEWFETITLYNNLGIPVYQQSSILSAEFEFDVHSLPEGVYRVEAVLSDQEVVYQSMVIQR